jgi:hypothetical protein
MQIIVNQRVGNKRLDQHLLTVRKREKAIKEHLDSKMTLIVHYDH